MNKVTEKQANKSLVKQKPKATCSACDGEGKIVFFGRIVNCWKCLGKGEIDAQE